MKSGDPWRTHRVAAQDEDVAWLTDQGVPLEEACARAGVLLDTYQRRHDPSRTHPTTTR